MTINRVTSTDQDNRIPHEQLLTPGEVAAMLRVDTKTVGRWARKGLISTVRTPTGRHRYREADVRAILNGQKS